MTREFDPIKSYLTLKAHEKMIAYVSLRFPMDGKNRGREGVIKISSFHRPYGGGQLTLTFIIDTEGDEDQAEQCSDQEAHDDGAAGGVCSHTRRF